MPDTNQEKPEGPLSSSTEHAMKATRESFYRCTFNSTRSRRVAHVRAWDAGEAVQLFRTELKTDGVDERGTIEVTGMRGGEEEHAAYRP
jgi:DNA replicative helicase MCM subunit Mcm2 (Cdc46/Mcm family)